MAEKKELDGPFCMMTVPITQLANAKVFVAVFKMRTCFHGCSKGSMMWLVIIEDLAEWPHEFPAYLKGSGIALEDLGKEFEIPDARYWMTGEL